MEDLVLFKGSKDKLKVYINSEVQFEKIIEELTAKIDSSLKFFKGANLPVVLRGRNLDQNEREEIAKIIKTNVGLEVIEETQEDVREDIERQISLQANAKTFADTLEEGMTKFYRGTMRSGQLIKFNGNVVVIGDVNPGAEIAATGNIIVMGNLRGIVHAGSKGNKNAIVCAFSMYPTQLRIADIITRPPDEKVEKANLPELACIRNNDIYIENYLPTK